MGMSETKASLIFLLQGMYHEAAKNEIVESTTKWGRFCGSKKSFAPLRVLWPRNGTAARDRSRLWVRTSRRRQVEAIPATGFRRIDDDAANGETHEAIGHGIPMPPAGRLHAPFPIPDLIRLQFHCAVFSCPFDETDRSVVRAQNVCLLHGFYGLPVFDAGEVCVAQIGAVQRGAIKVRS